MSDSFTRNANILAYLIECFGNSINQTVAKFSQSNLDKFFEKLIAQYQSIEIEYEAQGQLERSLTRNQVGPALQKFANSLIMPQLIVRYDGRKSVRPLLRYGMTFLPDAQATLENQKIVAIEV